MQLEQFFPYDSFRLGQRELTESVYWACKNRSRLVVEAMSGFGKTASVLTGALLAAEEEDKRIIYVCRTKRQVFRVIEEIGRIQRKAPVRAVQLFAKSDYCLLKETSKFSVGQESFRWYCSFNTTNNLCSYFLNLTLVDKKVGELVAQLGERVFTHSELLDASRKAHICPYEIVRITLATSQVVVTTYHYFLDEAARSLLLSSTGWRPSQTTVVIDEAHNLRDFLRDNYTSQLSLADITRAEQDAAALYLGNAQAFMKLLGDTLRQLSSEGSQWYVDRQSLVRRIQKNHDAAWLPNLALELSTCAGIGWQTVSTGKNLPTSIMKVGAFLTDLISSGATTPVARSEDRLYLVETDPSNRFRKLTSDYNSLILLSATINPSDLFLRSIGLEEDTRMHRTLPGHKFQVRTVIDTGTTTRYKMRNPSTYRKTASKVGAVCRATEGSVAVFVPSYVMLEALRPFLSGAVADRELIAEERDLSNREAEEMIDRFKSRPGSVLLAVQGARFSEGEDFPGNEMAASIVVGLSLPPPSPMMYAEFAQSKFGRHDTYLLISLLPAMRKAVQSAGRHIRSPDKRGMVFLLDSRFAQPELMQLMPGWLRDDTRKGDFKPDEIESMVKEFFS